MNKDFTKGLVAGFILSLFTIYSFFRIYWIMEIGVKYFRWHAVLWLYLSVALIFFGISYWLYKREKLKSPSAQKYFLLVSGLIIGIYTAEILLRLLHIGTTYSEQREGVFVNPAERVQKSWYMLYSPCSSTELKTQEYSFLRSSNSEGFSDKDWTVEKDSNEIKIITLGDSFTDGDGCPQDSSYPRVLEGLLQSQFPEFKITVMNAARCGSDPWFEFKKLHDLLLKYKPDIVVYTNGSNDMFFDHLMYGGMERFSADSTVKNKIPHHGWLGLYEVNYVFRLMMNFSGYDETLFGVEDRERNKLTAIADSRELSRQFSQLAVANNFTCVQLIRPERPEIRAGEYPFSLNDLMNGSDTLPSYSTFDLLAYYQESRLINKSNVDDYFWPSDGHHNTKGYRAMAQGVAHCVKEIIEKKKPQN